MSILRTPDYRFQNLPDYPFEPHYIEINAVRVHYVHEGRGDEIILCLHGEPSWSFLYRRMIQLFKDTGYRVVAPDFIGFGRSDKFANFPDYSFAMHAKMLSDFIEGLDLSNITLIGQDWGGMLGLNAVREMPERFARLVIMNTGLPSGEVPMPPEFMHWQQFAAKATELPIGVIIQNSTVCRLSPEVIAAYEAPFPDRSYQAGALVFPVLVPIFPGQPGAAQMKATQQFLATWQKPTLVIFSDSDPMTAGGDKWFRNLIPTAQQQPEIIIKGAGHFLQEDKGEEIAHHIINFIQRTC